MSMYENENRPKNLDNTVQTVSGLNKKSEIFNENVDFKSNTDGDISECDVRYLSIDHDLGQINRLSMILKALGDPIRLKIVLLLIQADDKSSCVCNLNLSFDISQPTLSHHLKILKDAQVLNKTKKANWAYYSINPQIEPLLTAALKDDSILAV